MAKLDYFVGPGLVFVVYPEGLATMPGAPIWAVLFFFMMTTLGFSSQVMTYQLEFVILNNIWCYYNDIVLSVTFFNT